MKRWHSSLKEWLQNVDEDKKNYVYYEKKRDERYQCV